MNVRLHESATAAVDRYRTEFERVSPQLPGSRVTWVRRARERALERFVGTGFPSLRDEQWKYTNVGPLARRAFRTVTRGAQSSDVAPIEGIVFQELSGAHRLTFLNGIYRPELSDMKRLPAGVEVQSLAEALERQSAWIKSAFANRTEEANAFAALNTAFMTDGAAIRIPAGAVIEQPIYLVFIATEAEAAMHLRNLIVAGESAQATIIEQHAAADSLAYFTNSVTEIVAGDNASIEHYKLQMESPTAFHIAGVHATQKRDSRFISHSIALGASLARADISTFFEGQGCECILNGLYVVDGRQHVDHHTRIDHAQPNCTSREYYRGVLDGASRGVFNGKVIVHPDAQKTDAQQSNHNLLLSKDAEVDTKPELEIYADDVKCTHGATVGQLDENMLFYLRSRGVPKDLAKGLLVYAFAHEVIGRMRLTPVAKRLEQTLIERLPEGVGEFV